MLVTKNTRLQITPRKLQKRKRPSDDDLWAGSRPLKIPWTWSASTTPSWKTLKIVLQHVDKQPHFFLVSVFVFAASLLNKTRTWGRLSCSVGLTLNFDLVADSSSFTTTHSKEADEDRLDSLRQLAASKLYEVEAQRRARLANLLLALPHDYEVSIVQVWEQNEGERCRSL